MVDWASYRNKEQSGAVDWASYRNKEQSGAVDWASYRNTEQPESQDDTWSPGAVTRSSAYGYVKGGENIANALGNIFDPFAQIHHTLGGVDWAAKNTIGRDFGLQKGFDNLMPDRFQDGQYKWHITDDFTKQTGYQPENKMMADISTVAGETIPTLPLSLGTGTKFAHSLGLGALEGMGFTGLLEADQQRQKGEYDLGQLAINTGLGGVFGAAGGGIGHGVDKLIGKLSSKAGKMNLRGKSEAEIQDLLSRNLIDPEEAAAELRALEAYRQSVPEATSIPADVPISDGTGFTRPFADTMERHHQPRPSIEGLEVSGHPTVYGEAPIPHAVDPESFFHMVPEPEMPTVPTGHKPPLDPEDIITSHPTIEPPPQIQSADDFFGLSGRKVDPVMEAPPPQAPPTKPKSLMEQLQGESPAVKPIYGEARSPLELNSGGQTIHGQHRGALDGDLMDLLSPEEQQLAIKYASLKLAEEEAQRVSDNFAGGVYVRHGKGEPIKIDDITFEGPKKEVKQHQVLSKALAAVKEQFADFAELMPNSDNARATIDPKTMGLIKPEIPAVLDDLAANVPIARNLRQKLDDVVAQKKQTGKDLREVLRKVSKANPGREIKGGVAIGDRRVNVEYQKPQTRFRFMGDEVNKYLNREQKKLGKGATYLPSAEKKMRHDRIKQIAKEIGREVEDVEKYDAEITQRAAQRDAELAKVMDEFNSRGEGTYTTTRPGQIKKKSGRKKIATKIAQAIMAGSAVGLASDQEAQAYTTGGERGRRTDDALKVGGALLAGAVVVALSGSKGRAALNAWVKKGGAQASKLLGDTLDHVEMVDKVMGENLAQEILAHNVGAIRTNWGVNFKSDTLKAKAIEELRKGLDPDEALAGKAGTAFAELGDDARKAVVTFHAQRKTLAKKVREYRAKAKSNEYKDKLQLGNLYHLKALEQSISGQHDSANWVSSMTGGAMDYFFRLNPAFHMLNLSDSVIAGGARISPLKVAKAWNMLGTDDEIKTLFKNSNLLGSFKSDAVEMQSKGAVSKLDKLGDLDFSSDAFNAERVTLASFLMSHQKQGVQADTKTFIRAVIKNEPTGQITQDVIDKAWIGAADDSLRTLAVDPFKINKNAFSAIPNVGMFAAFINQPARIARLSNEFVKNGEYGKLATMIGLTAAVGGKAAIPLTMRSAAEYFDPDTAYAVNSLLDDYSIPGLVGNIARENAPNKETKKVVTALQRDLSRKLEWDPLLFLLASENPGIEAMRTAGEDMDDIAKARWDPSGENIYKAGKKVFDRTAQTGVASLLPGVRNIPMGVVGRGMKAAHESLAGEQTAYGFHPLTSARAGKKKINLDDIPMGRMLPFLDLFLAGDNAYKSGASNYLLERKNKKMSKSKKTGKKASYQSPLII